MNAAAEKHPDKDQLVDFGLGKLAEDDAARIEGHLQTCPDCQTTISDLKDDTFVALVRNSPPDESASDPGPGSPSISPDVTVAPESTAGGSNGKSSDLPRELQEHPRYEILELIGRGGMGDVYRAQHKVMNRVVALKVIKPELVRNEAAVERFRREVQAAARLHHANIVTAFDAEQAGDVHFLVMEFVDGVNLDEVVRRSGPLSIAEACECIRQAAIGLQYAHELGMVHRDVKPHNLIMADSRSKTGGLASDTVKILDFGLANFASETAEELIESEPDDSKQQAEVLHQLTEMGTMMGTPDFVAPEQAEDAHAADIRADIYSLGCTFFTLLTGRAPFASGTIAEKIRAHAKFDPPNLIDYRTDCPPVVEAIMRTMMAKNPSERYQTPGEVAAALDEVVVAARDDSFAGVTTQPESVPAPEQAKPKSKVRIALATMLLAVVACVAGVIVYLATDNGNLEIDNRSTDVEGAKIVLTKNGKEYATFELEPGTKKQTIRAGLYEISVQGVNDDVELQLSSKRLASGGVTLDNVKRQIMVYRGDDLVIDVSKIPIAVETNPNAVWDRANADIALGDHEQAITEAAATYLSVRDASDFDQLYRIASTYTRRKVSREHFIRANQIVDNGFGKVTHRKLVTARFFEQLHDMPKGNYAGIEFKTNFALQRNIWEMLLLVKEPDDKWRVHSYASMIKRIPFSGGSFDNVALTSVITQIGSLEGHTGPVKDLKYSHDGKWLASCSGYGEGADQTVRIWDLATGETKHTLEHDWPVMSVCFSPDDKFIVSCGRNRSVKMWNVADGTEAGEFAGGHDWMNDVVVSPDGKLVASCGGGGFAYLWDIQTKAKRRFSGASAMMLRVRFSPDSKRLFGANRDGQVMIWDVATGQREAIVPESTPPLRSGCGLALLDGGNEAIVGAADGIVKRWNLQTGELVWSADTNATIQAIETTPDEQTAVVCGSSRVITLIDVATGEVIAKDPSGLGTLWALAIAPSGNEFAVANGLEWDDGDFRATGDNAVYRWSLPEGTASRDPLELSLDRELKGHTGLGMSTASLAVTADGKRLISAGGKDQTARLWDTATGETIFVMPMENDGPLSVAIASDGTRAAVRGTRGMIDLWDLTEQVKLRTLDQTEVRGGAMAFSADSKRLVTGALPAGDNPPLSIVWDVANGERLHVHRFPFDEPVGAIAAVPGTDEVIFTAKHFWRWNTASGDLTSLVGWPESLGGDIDVSSDGKLAVITTNETLSLKPVKKKCSVELRNLASGELVKLFSTAEFDLGQGLPEMPVSVCFLSGDQQVAVGYAHGEIRVFEVDSGREVAAKKEIGAMPNLAPVADGRIAATGILVDETPRTDPTIAIWKIAEAEPGVESSTDPEPVDNQATRTNAARATALKWLKHADAGEFDKCVALTAAGRGKGPSVEEVVAIARIARKKWGKAGIRREVGALVSHAAGVDLVEIRYHTTFENAQSTHEVLNLIRQADGKWGVAAYAARNAQGNLPITLDEEESNSRGR